jgi:sugar phosphate isomerase/epimerase
MKVGTRSWNFRRDLRSGVLTMEGLLRATGELGLEGVELLVGQLPQFTLRMADRLQRTAAHLGVEIPAYAVENDFAFPSPEVRRAEVETVCHWIKLAGAVGVPYVRLYTGDRHERAEAEAQRGWVKECLLECAQAAEACGVTLAIENHSSVCFDYSELLALVKGIDNRHCRVCLDAYNACKFTGGEGVYQAAEALVGLTPYTYLQFYEIDPSGRELHVDVPRLLRIYERAGYDGYLMIKWHREADPYWAVGVIARYVRTVLLNSSAASPRRPGRSAP